MDSNAEIRGLKIAGRIIFWPIFLFGVLGVGLYYWEKQPPQQVKNQLALLSHANAKVSSAAWKKLYQLFYTDWAAYYLILNEVNNKAPISFLLEDQVTPMSDGTERPTFFANGKPIYFKSDRVYCRTVGEAIMAIAHNEQKVTDRLPLNWNTWWRENKKHFDSGSYQPEV